MARQDLSCANGCPRTPTRFQAFSRKVQISSLILLTYGTKGGILNLLKANTPDGADVCLSHGHDHQHSEQDIGEGFAQEEGSEGVHSWCECGQPELQPCEFVRRVVQLFMEGSFMRRLLGKANHSKWRLSDPSTKVRKNVWFENWFINPVMIWNVDDDLFHGTFVQESSEKWYLWIFWSALFINKKFSKNTGPKTKKLISKQILCKSIQCHLTGN